MTVTQTEYLTERQMSSEKTFSRLYNEFDEFVSRHQPILRISPDVTTTIFAVYDPRLSSFEVVKRVSTIEVNGEELGRTHVAEGLREKFPGAYLFETDIPRADGTGGE
ncbi:MAG: hypothetical protein KKD18_05995 [Nanoarchaeota archaeon]|nr:hypothetical protein [Nanoarchaeota archaeon]